jgi:hypothetical protein
MLGGFVVVVALIGFYVASLHFSPWVKCSKCHGKPRPVVGCLATHTRSAPSATAPDMKFALAGGCSAWDRASRPRSRIIICLASAERSL